MSRINNALTGSGAGAWSAYFLPLVNGRATVHAALDRAAILAESRLSLNKEGI